MDFTRTMGNPCTTCRRVYRRARWPATARGCETLRRRLETSGPQAQLPGALEAGVRRRTTARRGTVPLAGVQRRNATSRLSGPSSSVMALPWYGPTPHVRRIAVSRLSLSAVQHGWRQQHWWWAVSDYDLQPTISFSMRRLVFLVEQLLH